MSSYSLCLTLVSLLFVSCSVSFTCSLCRRAEWRSLGLVHRTSPSPRAVRGVALTTRLPIPLSTMTLLLPLPAGQTPPLKYSVLISSATLSACAPCIHDFALAHLFATTVTSVKTFIFHNYPYSAPAWHFPSSFPCTAFPLFALPACNSGHQVLKDKQYIHPCMWVCL